MKKILVPSALLFLLAGCGHGTSFVRSDTTLGRVVVYRNGVAYFERYAELEDDTLRLSVPGDKVDDFLKSLTVVDAQTRKPAPISYPTVGENFAGQPDLSQQQQQTPGSTSTVDMKIQLQGPRPHKVILTYVTEAPSWKPSYRMMLDGKGNLKLEGWAIVDNTSGEDWKNVKLGVGSSSAMSFRFDLRSVRMVQRETLQSNDLFAQAPPMGGATYANGPQQQPQKQRVVVDMDDARLATNLAQKDEERRGGMDKEVDLKKQGNWTPPPPPRVATRGAAGGGKGPSVATEPTSRTGDWWRDEAGKRPTAKPAEAPAPADDLTRVARSLSNTGKQIVVEGYADRNDKDKYAASLERANRAREQLLRAGLDPSQVVAVGNGEQAGRAGGVRIVEADQAQQEGQSGGFEKTATLLPGAPASEPIGTSHFESETPMNVPRLTSAMVSILNAETKGEFVYLYDPDSPRGNASFPFRSVRIVNPTDSALESGPVTVFSDGRFIGEGLSEPIPAHATAFIPFALDRQVVVERKDDGRDEIARILTVQRGVFSTEVKHTKRTTLTLTNRMQDKAVVYVRHVVSPGYKLGKAPPSPERMGEAHLFRIELGPGAKQDVVIEEETPLFRSTDIRSNVGMELVRAYLTNGAASGKLKEAVGKLLDLQKEMGNLEQRIGTMREQMNEYRARMDELHMQIVTLKAVKSGGPLMQSLEKKMQEVSDRLSKATIDLVALEEKLMLARIRFQDGVAELSLDQEPTAESTSPKG
jgi:outer membrane protein OmpA-like peptidoglycan-associated protein